VNGEERAAFHDAVVAIELQPHALWKVCHHAVQDIIDLRILHPFLLARALEGSLQFYFAVTTLVARGHALIDLHRKASFVNSLQWHSGKVNRKFGFTIKHPFT